MSIFLKRSNGTAYANLPNRLILGPNVNNSFQSCINLIGQSHISFGKAQNENYLWIAENFAGDTAPVSITGQTWLKPSDILTGQLMLAPVDRALNSEWAAIPMVNRSISQPLPSELYNGTMAIIDKTQLKVVLDSEWFEIETATFKNTYEETLLAIEYNDTFRVYNASYDVEAEFPEDYLVEEKVSFVTSSWKPIARYTTGGEYSPDLDVVINDEKKMLQFGKTYNWSAVVIGKGAVFQETADPYYTAVKLQGTFSIANASDQRSWLEANLDTSTVYAQPDPRLLQAAIRDTVGNDVAYATGILNNTQFPSEDSSWWEVRAVPGEDYKTLPLDIETDIADASMYGLVFEVRTPVGPHRIQWSVEFTIAAV